MEEVKSDNTTVYLSLGSNLGDRLQNLQSAIDSINSKVGKICSVSSVYETPPLGFESNEHFYNICLSLYTQLDPIELLFQLQQIEIELGRKRKSGEENGIVIYSSRIIDIDILFYGSLLIDSEKLSIPHALFADRKFVLFPLNEIASNFTDPLSKLEIKDLLSMCNDTSILYKTNTILKI